MPNLGVNAVIFNQSGQVLLTRREDFDIWCLPSGGVEHGESLAEAARRETLEETGLQVRLTRLVGVYSRLGDASDVSAGIVFAGGIAGGSLRPQPGETTALEWFDPQHLPDDLVVTHRLRLRHAVEGRGGSAAWKLPFDWRYPPGTDRDALYRLRDESGLEPRQFHRCYLNRAAAPGPLREDGAGHIDSSPASLEGGPASNPWSGNPPIDQPSFSSPRGLATTFGAAVAVFHQGRLLLTERNDFHVWCLPGGHSEPGELLAETARRELFEEIGLHVRLTRLVGIYSKLNWLEKGIHVFLFAGEPVKPDGAALSPDEADALLTADLPFDPAEVRSAGFFAPNDLPADFFFGHDLMAQDALNGVGGSAAFSQLTPRLCPGLTRAEIYALRDRSGLSRAEFFRRNQPPVMPGEEIDQLL